MKDKIEFVEPENNVKFFTGKGELMILMNEEGFFFKGEKVEDAHNVYERFNEWLLLAEK